MCGDEEAGCPEGSQCLRSSVSGLRICCMPRDAPTIGFELSSKTAPSPAPSSAPLPNPRHHSSFSSSKVSKIVPKCSKDDSLPFFALGSRVPQQCTAERDDECPEEYECELATDDNYVSEESTVQYHTVSFEKRNIVSLWG